MQTRSSSLPFIYSVNASGLAATSLLTFAPTSRMDAPDAYEWQAPLELGASLSTGLYRATEMYALSDSDESGRVVSFTNTFWSQRPDTTVSPKIAVKFLCYVEAITKSDPARQTEVAHDQVRASSTSRT